MRVPRNPYATLPRSFMRGAYGTKIVSRQKHNMLSLLHAACLKLFFVLFTSVDFSGT